MQKNRGSSLMLMIAIAAISALAGCNNNPPPPPYVAPQPTVIVRQPPMAQAAPAAPTSNLTTASFNVGLVSDMLKGGQVTDAQSLEKIVNDPNSGINAVDIDGNGQTDFVAVQETGNGNQRQYEFVAYPDSQNGQNPTTVASITLIVNGPNVTVNAGYPQYVNGWQSGYYQDTWGYHSNAFLMWMLLANRPIYALRPYGYYGSYYHWSPYRVMSPQVMTTRRTTYYTTHTTVSPIRSTAPPPAYRGATATKVPPAVVRQPPPATSNLGDRQGTVRSFQNETRAKPTITGGGAPMAKPPVAPPVRTAPPPPRAPTSSYRPPPPRSTPPSPRRGR